MSTIREKPYIEELLASMSEQNLQDLKTILDSGGDNVNLSFATLTDSYKNKVTPVYFQFEDNGLKTGILIWTDTKCALICYHRFQDLIIFEFSPTYHTYTKIKQYCDINELRRVLDDTIEKKGAVDSGDAAEGSVPFADGEGGVTWDKPTEYIKGDDFEDAETTVKMIAIDDEGNLVKANLPEGTFVVDSALSNVSENPVQNKVITEELDKIKDGRTAVGKAQTAQALDNVSENSGSTQEDPFIFQGTGTNNNISETPTSPKAHQLEKQGNTACVNQWNDTITDTVNMTDGESYTILNNKGLSNTSNNQVLVIGKVDFSASSNANSNIVHFNVSATGHSNYINENIDVTNGMFAKVFTLDYDSSTITLYAFANTTFGSGESVTYSDYYIINLTQWGFDSTTLTYLTTHPEAFINYYQGSLAYNEGTLVNCDGQYLVTIGFNQFDKDTVKTSAGNYILNDNGQQVADSSSSYFLEYIRVIPNTTYYFNNGVDENGIQRIYYYDNNKNWISRTPAIASGTTFTTKTNCCYIRIQYKQNSFSADTLCLNLSWDRERNGEYEDFVKHVYDTGTETLLAFDVKHYTGVIERNTGNVNLGSLEWTKGSGVISASLTNCKAINTNPFKGKTTLTLPIIAFNVFSADPYPIGIAVNGTSGKIWIRDGNGTEGLDALIASLSGVYLQYELATPTTEQGTPFDEIIDVDDYGTMYWLDDNEDFVEVPQGCKLFYPADYALLIDDLGNYTNYDVTKLAKKSDIDDTTLAARGYVKLTSITGYDATKTQVLKNVEGTLTWVDEV